MSAQEFISLLVENISSFIMAFLFSHLMFYYIYRYRVRSILDPLLVKIFFIGCANSVPLFLFLIKSIEVELFFFFVASQVLFWILFYFGFSKKHKQNIIINEWEKFDTFFLLVCLTIYIVSILFYVKLNGIPIFNDNRFARNYDGVSGLLGLLERLKSSVSLLLVIYSIYLFNSKKRIIGVALLFLIISCSILFGSKAFILLIIEGFFFYYLFYCGKLPSIKTKYIIIIVLTPVLVITLSNVGSSYGSAFLFYAYRLLANGDMYWNAYPNNVVGEIDMGNPLINMTYYLWAPFRHIIGLQIPDEIMTTGGSRVFEIASGFEPTGGAPNSSFSLMFWIYYKWWGLIGVAVMGRVCAKMCCLQTYKKKNTLINVCFRGLLYMCALSFILDIYLFFNGLFNLFLFYIIYKGMKLLYGLLIVRKNV